MVSVLLDSCKFEHPDGRHDHAPFVFATKQLFWCTAPRFVASQYIGRGEVLQVCAKARTIELAQRVDLQIRELGIHNRRRPTELPLIASRFDMLQSLTLRGPWRDVRTCWFEDETPQQSTSESTALPRI